MLNIDMGLDDKDTLLTVEEAATLIKYSQKTIRRWISDLSLPHYRGGRKILIKKSDLLARIGINDNPKTEEPKS